jgi:hypothetical protein
MVDMSSAKVSGWRQYAKGFVLGAVAASIKPKKVKKSHVLMKGVR